MKATYCIVDGEERLIFKNPITDNGTKKSQKGMVAVVQDENGAIRYVDQLDQTTIKDYDSVNLLESVFKDGKLLRDESLADIRARLESTL